MRPNRSYKNKFTFRTVRKAVASSIPRLGARLASPASTVITQGMSTGNSSTDFVTFYDPNNKLANLPISGSTVVFYGLPIYGDSWTGVLFNKKIAGNTGWRFGGQFGNNKLRLTIAMNASSSVDFDTPDGMWSGGVAKMYAFSFSAPTLASASVQFYTANADGSSFTSYSLSPINIVGSASASYQSDASAGTLMVGSDGTNNSLNTMGTLFIYPRVLSPTEITNVITSPTTNTGSAVFASWLGGPQGFVLPVDYSPSKLVGYRNGANPLSRGNLAGIPNLPPTLLPASASATFPIPAVLRRWDSSSTFRNALPLPDMGPSFDHTKLHVYKIDGTEIPIGTSLFEVQPYASGAPTAVRIFGPTDSNPSLEVVIDYNATIPRDSSFADPGTPTASYPGAALLPTSHPYLRSACASFLGDIEPSYLHANIDAIRRQEDLLRGMVLPVTDAVPQGTGVHGTHYDLSTNNTNTDGTAHYNRTTTFYTLWVATADPEIWRAATHKIGVYALEWFLPTGLSYVFQNASDFIPWYLATADERVRTVAYTAHARNTSQGVYFNSWPMNSTDAPGHPNYLANYADFRFVGKALESFRAAWWTQTINGPPPGVTAVPQTQNKATYDEYIRLLTTVMPDPDGCIRESHYIANDTTRTGSADLVGGQGGSGTQYGVKPYMAYMAATEAIFYKLQVNPANTTVTPFIKNLTDYMLNVNYIPRTGVRQGGGLVYCTVWFNGTGGDSGGRYCDQQWSTVNPFPMFSIAYLAKTYNDPGYAAWWDTFNATFTELDDRGQYAPQQVDETYYHYREGMAMRFAVTAPSGSASVAPALR